MLMVKLIKAKDMVAAETEKKQNTDDGKLGKSTEKVMHERPTIAEVNIDKKAKRWL